MTCEKQVQIKDKFCLTIDEAAEYFNIGEKKLRKIVADYYRLRICDPERSEGAD